MWIAKNQKAFGQLVQKYRKKSETISQKFGLFGISLFFLSK
jgi:hypothetical protein